MSYIRRKNNVGEVAEAAESRGAARGRGSVAFEDCDAVDCGGDVVSGGVAVE